MRRFVVFVNASAGSVAEVDDELTNIERAFAAAGISAEVSGVDPALLPDAMREAWEGKPDAIVVAGGDGSVNCAAGVAVEHEMLLGVLPMGTFNHFAKDVGAPTDDIAASAAWLASGVETLLDVGEVNGRIFVNNASIGVYPRMVVDRDAIRDARGWGKIRAVPVAVARTLHRLPVLRLRVSVDGGASATLTTPFLFIGNGLFDRGGQRLGKRIALDDHLLGVYTITTTSRWRLVADAITARVRGVQAAQHTHRQSAESLVIESDEAKIDVAVDGEPTQFSSPLHFRSRPAALRLLVGPETT
jgi:diacylglycerol kinase family enzyme